MQDALTHVNNMRPSLPFRLVGALATGVAVLGGIWVLQLCGVLMLPIYSPAVPAETPVVPSIATALGCALVAYIYRPLLANGSWLHSAKIGVLATLMSAFVVGAVWASLELALSVLGYVHSADITSIYGFARRLSSNAGASVLFVVMNGYAVLPLGALTACAMRLCFHESQDV